MSDPDLTKHSRLIELCDRAIKAEDDTSLRRTIDEICNYLTEQRNRRALVKKTSEEGSAVTT